MELFPCPFCGHVADFCEDEDGWRWVECTSCGVGISHSAGFFNNDSKEHLSVAWNSRASPASVPEVTDGMAIAFHNALTDGAIGQAEVDEIKTGLRAALAAAPTPPVSEDHWLPIETAPKDGSKFLAWRRHSTIPLIVFYNAEYDQYECNDGHLVFSITHWMPLPKAPAMQEDKP